MSRNASAGTRIPTNSASPPSRGTGNALSRLASGASTAPIRRAICPTAGVSNRTIASASAKPQTTSGVSLSSSSTAAYLLRAVEPVARVAETRDDEAALVELAVDRRAHDVHVGMVAMHAVDALLNGDQADERHRPR